MANMPEMAKGCYTVLYRAVIKFHEKLLERLGKDSGEYTLRKTAWQLDEYLEEHGKYIDAEFIQTLIHTIEFVIQKKCNQKGGKKWTVEWAKKSLMGRTKGVNQFGKQTTQPKRPKVPVDLSQSIESRLIDTAQEVSED
jgi:hypothetical protein